MRAALVTTILNEAPRLAEFLDSVERQSRKPDVVVVTDGGSTDGSQRILDDFAKRTAIPFVWAAVPGNRSRGRNEAIRRSGADVLAVADVGVLDPEWFARIVAPIESGAADLAVGWYQVRSDDRRERAIGLLTQYSIGQVSGDRMLPNSRSLAFTRALWEKVGGYPEAFDAGEDTVMGLAFERLHPRRVFIPEAVLYYRPPGTATGVYRQYRGYAVGDGRAGIYFLRGTRYALVYGVWIAGALLLVAGFLWWPWWAVLLLGAAAYAGFRVRKVLRPGIWTSIPYSLGVLAAWDVGRMVGYLEGRIDRLRKGPDAFRV